MKKELAEALLAKIMGWTDAEKARERARLESFAAYKYDGYQQYAPGRRFIESLALWLRQFDPGEERRLAYEFVRNRLMFISEDEMNYLVGLVFPTVIRPMLLADAAAEAGIAPERLKAVVAAPEYRARLRRTLFLGLSDGAHTDQFRRANPQDISNEQVFHAYDISDAKAETMIGKLKKDLCAILRREPSDDEARFQYVVLADDFSASGTSAIRFKDGQWDGKIPRIVEDLLSDKGLGLAIACEDVKVVVVLYVAADQAIGTIGRLLDQLEFPKGSISFEVVCRLGPDAPLDDIEDAGILGLVKQDRYFDPSVDDEHAAVAGTSKRLGYAECRLPLVMSHNTPNNSIFLLWAEEDQSVSGLFPRVSRHRKRQ
jgi:hypothetical protein